MLISNYKLTGETPSKKNSRIGLRSGKNIPSERYQKWKKAKYIELLHQGILCPPIDKPLKIDFFFYHADNRTHDTDNQISSILDLLKDAKVIKDDNWKIVKRISAEALSTQSKESWVNVVISDY
jgi:Holliday junction resolvase RusA-like endonuclease